MSSSSPRSSSYRTESPPQRRRSSVSISGGSGCSSVGTGGNNSSGPSSPLKRTSATTTTTASNSNSNNVIWLTLELTANHNATTNAGTTRSSSKNNAKDNFSVRRMELNDESIRLQVVVPNSMDAEASNLTAAILFEQMDMIRCSSSSSSSNNKDTTILVERVKLQGLSFTLEGVQAWNAFLSQHAASVKHVSLKDMISTTTTTSSSSSHVVEESYEVFRLLAQVFHHSKLEIVNLSDNQLNDDSTNLFWKEWSHHTTVRQLILDYVVMDDASLQALASQFGTFGQSVEELYVVLLNVPGPKGVQASNDILRQCQRVSSLRWAIKDAPPEAKLPYSGLADMVATSSESTTAQSLLHLVMDGGTIVPLNEQKGDELYDLCTALGQLTALKTLKFRSIGLTDDCVAAIAQALARANPPLESIDWSRNFIQCHGAKAIAEYLANTTSTSNTSTNGSSSSLTMMKSLNVLLLERNQIQAPGARILLEALGESTMNPRLDIRLDNNPFPWGKVAFALACRKGGCEIDKLKLQDEIKKLQHQLQVQQQQAQQQELLLMQQQQQQQQQQANQRNSSPSPDVVGATRDSPSKRVLLDEIQTLRDERDALIKAFSVMGAMHRVEEHLSIQERLAHLERTVLGNSMGGSNTASSPPGRAVTPRNSGDVSHMIRVAPKRSNSGQLSRSSSLDQVDVNSDRDRDRDRDRSNSNLQYNPNDVPPRSSRRNVTAPAGASVAAPPMYTSPTRTMTRDSLGSSSSMIRHPVGNTTPNPHQYDRSGSERWNNINGGSGSGGNNAPSPNIIRKTRTLTSENSFRPSLLKNSSHHEGSSAKGLNHIDEQQDGLHQSFASGNSSRTLNTFNNSSSNFR